MSRAVYWFTNDLRLSDNLALNKALTAETEVSFIYCLDPRLFKKGRFLCASMGEKRYRFLLEALEQIDEKLQGAGQCLHVYYQVPETLFESLHRDYGVDRIYHSAHAGYYERKIVEVVKSVSQDITFVEADTHTLYARQDLPFEIADLPETFSKFRRLVENSNLTIPSPLEIEGNFGRPFLKRFNWRSTLPNCLVQQDSLFSGGERHGLQYLENYFQHDYAQTYKETRNALDQPEASTRFSPWLSHGCISVRQVMFYLRRHESTYGANESTYWIYFELLWREYFQWYAHRHNEKLFNFGGIKNKKPLTSFYDERYQRWCQGSTSFPIVNACMKQLNATGYMSNRGRQLVASCFINELELDWRYGAAYFEQHLIDYDVASNWGNWQYLAGVGADPRGLRRFNLEKQTQTYDPSGEFIQQWQGDTDCIENDSVDAVGWPVSPPEK